MSQREQDPDIPLSSFSVSQSGLACVDAVLLAVAGRLWELTRDTTPPTHQATQMPWQAEERRKSLLGQRLLFIAEYAQRGYGESARVERVMQRVLRTLFGDPLGEGYTVPAQFHTTELGQLFHRAYSHMYQRADLMTPVEVYRELGVARQSVYDRMAKGKLHPIYFYGKELRLLRREVEEWKAQRRKASLSPTSQ